MEDGLWDKAFKMSQNEQVAFSLKDNIFGKAKYVGNHMLNIAENQTMFDAYDALIFLAPLDNLHFSAEIDFIYTEPFKKELKRRIEILEGHNIKAFLSENNVSTIEEYIEQECQYQTRTKNKLIDE